MTALPTVFFQCACGTSFRVHVVSRSLAEGTCPTCGQRVQVSMERPAEVAVRRTWQEWDHLFQFTERIMDPDGFRGRHRNEDDLYTEDEFLKGRMLCTLVSRREFPDREVAS